MIGWLSDFWTREGRGVPKDAPRSVGLRLFGEIVWRELWDLFLLNLLIVVCSLPVVTAPAAQAAALRVTSAMVRDENIWLFADFRKAFRQVFLRATLAGAATAATVGLGLYAVYVWMQIALNAPPVLMAAAAGAAVVCASASVFALMVAAQLFSFIAASALPLRRLLRPALVAVLARPSPLLGALSFIAALWAAHLAFYPVSIFMPATLSFSLGVLGLSFAAPPSLRLLPQETEDT